MFSIKEISKVSALIMGLSLLAPPSLSFARDNGRHEDHHYYRYHERPSFGLQLTFVPDDAFVVRTREARYYYYDGLYYTKIGGDFVLVTPPIGAVVAAIPPEYRPIVINGITYYVDNGTYYIYTRYGYQVVQQPATMTQAPVIVTQPAPAPVIVQASITQPQPVATAPAASVTASAATPAADEVFTINIPNTKSGGYTAVTIKRSGAGFVGPQGEFYAEFPKVAQLQTVYGK